MFFKLDSGAADPCETHDKNCSDSLDNSCRYTLSDNNGNISLPFDQINETTSYMARKHSKNTEYDSPTTFCTYISSDNMGNPSDLVISEGSTDLSCETTGHMAGNQTSNMSKMPSNIQGNRNPPPLSKEAWEIIDTEFMNINKESWQDLCAHKKNVNSSQKT